MKITISTLQSHALAEEFASAIHGEIMIRHAIRSWGIWPSEYGPPERNSSSFREVGAAVRSIKDQYERQNFVCTIRYYFNKKVQQHGTERCWQEYVVKVRAAYAEHQRRLGINHLPAPLHERGIATQPVEAA